MFSNHGSRQQQAVESGRDDLHRQHSGKERLHETAAATAVSVIHVCDEPSTVASDAIPVSFPPSLNSSHSSDQHSEHDKTSLTTTP